MHNKHASGWDQDKGGDAWEEWVAGRGEAPAKPVVRLFGRWTPSNGVVGWLLTVLGALIVGCTLLVLSGCADVPPVAYALQRGIIGADCRPNHLQTNGQCSPLR